MRTIEDWNIRELFDSVPDVVYVLDREWRIVYANRNMLEYFDAFVSVEGASYWEAFPEARGTIFADAIERVMLNGGSHTVEGWSIYHPDRWVELRAFAVSQGVAVYVSNITARHTAQMREQETLGHLRVITDSLPALVAYVDADERYRFNNRRYADWFGLEPDSIRGRSVREVLGDEVYAALKPHIVRVLAGEQVEYEQEMAYQHGPPRVINAAYVPDRAPDGTVRGWVAVIRDVTEVRQSEALTEEYNRRIEQVLNELAASEERYRTFIAQSSEGIWRFELDEPIETTLDADAQVERIYKDGYLAECNDAFARMYGFASADEIIGMRVVDFLIPEDPRNIAFLHAAIAADYRLSDAESVEKDRDGNTKYYLNNVLGIVENGALTRVWGTQRDITDQQRIEEERQQLLAAERAARSEAEYANRVKDEFLSTLSHELRTPLNAIFGWAQLLRTEEELAPQVRQGLEVIERNARSQTRIVEDLLDLSRIVTGKVRLDVQRVDPALVIGQALETIAPAAEARGVRIEPDIDTSAGEVMGDPSRLQQVVWNLLSNAVKFTQHGGRVQVRLERVDSHVEISVADTGLGIRPEFMPHIFERFRQADASSTRAHGGLGIGLAVVKQLVELHGGVVHASSPGEGLGATFVVRLPRASAQEPVDASSQRDAQSAGEHARRVAGLRLLVVDDEPDARELVRRLFIECDAIVATAGSAEEAFSLLTTFRPDLIISDIGMPGEDGYGLIQRIRALTPHEGGGTPAIALTAFARSEDRRRAILAGYQVHLAKPVEPAELISCVAGLTGRLPTPADPTEALSAGTSPAPPKP